VAHGTLVGKVSFENERHSFYLRGFCLNDLASYLCFLTGSTATARKLRGHVSVFLNVCLRWRGKNKYIIK